jgi:hypothetical protein
MIVYQPSTRGEPAKGASSLTEVHTVGISPLGLPGNLRIPTEAGALVLFAHGSGSSRLSRRNMAVADRLNVQGMATLLFDLLSIAWDTRPPCLCLPRRRSCMVDLMSLDLVPTAMRRDGGDRRAESEVRDDNKDSGGLL